jgi:hypothetical protein
MSAAKPDGPPSRLLPATGVRASGHYRFRPCGRGSAIAGRVCTGGERVRRRGSACRPRLSCRARASRLPPRPAGHAHGREKPGTCRLATAGRRCALRRPPSQPRDGPAARKRVQQRHSTPFAYPKTSVPENRGSFPCKAATSEGADVGAMGADHGPPQSPAVAPCATWRRRSCPRCGSTYRACENCLRRRRSG